MGNHLQTLPQADPELVRVLFLAHQAQQAYSDWCGKLPNDTFWKSHWEDFNKIDAELSDLKCEIATLISNKLLDNLDKNG